MYSITYHRASSVEEAASLLTSFEEGKFIAGGQTLIPTMKLRIAAPSHLVDLRHIETLKGITVEKSMVTIGAMTTHAEVAGSVELHSVCPSLCALAGGIGDPAVRYMGTIGGSVANNDPAADYPAAMMALGASIVTNRRTIVADDFFKGLFETALDDTEIIAAIRFKPPVRGAYAKFPSPASRFAMTGVFVAQADDGIVRVGVTGAGLSGVFRQTGFEQALTNDWSQAALDNVSVDESMMLSDIHANATYRVNLVKVMAKRAVAAASGMRK